MFRELEGKSKELGGLKIHLGKTKFISNQHVRPYEVILKSTKIEQAEGHVYLGQKVSLNDSTQEREILRRIRISWSNFEKMKKVMTSTLPMCLKKKIFYHCIYGAETWTTTKKLDNKLRVSQRAMERIMAGISRRDQWKKTNLRYKTKVIDIITTIKTSKWRWAGHVARINDNR